MESGAGVRAALSSLIEVVGHVAGRVISDFGPNFVQNRTRRRVWGRTRRKLRSIIRVFIHFEDTRNLDEEKKHSTQRTYRVCTKYTSSITPRRPGRAKLFLQVSQTGRVCTTLCARTVVTNAQAKGDHETIKRYPKIRKVPVQLLPNLAPESKGKSNEIQIVRS